MSAFEFDPVFFTGAVVLFSVAACTMLLAPLILGYFLRPNEPEAEKGAIYECGEPTIGSSNVQFDLRFYVVALLFIVFDVEVAFFFPWAVVFGKAKTLATPPAVLSEIQRKEISATLLSDPNAAPITTETAQKFLRIAFADVLVFFGIVLVGFAYVWKRGDLDWVRSVARQRALEQAGRPPTPNSAQPVLVA